MSRVLDAHEVERHELVKTDESNKIQHNHSMGEWVRKDAQWHNSDHKSHLEVHQPRKRPRPNILYQPACVLWSGGT